MLFKKKNQIPKYEYNPEKEYAVIRASICTGEQSAGFKDKVTGEFHEIMLIKKESDLDDFKKAFNIEKIEKEY